jgi:hypothetical protein
LWMLLREAMSCCSRSIQPGGVEGDPGIDWLEAVIVLLLNVGHDGCEPAEFGHQKANYWLSWAPLRLVLAVAITDHCLQHRLVKCCYL